jgi:anti-sigma factor RsiW
MRCSDVRENLGRAADGELDAGTAAALQAHLGGCPDCAARRLGLERLGALLAALPAEPVPGGLERSILEAARFLPPRPAPSRHPFLAAAGRVAAALLVALSGLYLGLRFSQIQRGGEAPGPAALAADPLAPDTAPFRLVPPGTPGAVALDLLDPEAR